MELGQPQMWDRVPHGDSRQGGGRWGSPRAVFCSAQPFRSALEIPPSFRQFIYASQPAEPFGLLCGLGFFGVVVFFFLKGFQKRFPAPSQPRSARSPGAGRPPPPAAAPRTEASPRPPAAGGAEIQQPQPLALARAGGEAKSAFLNFCSSSHRATVAHPKGFAPAATQSPLSEISKALSLALEIQAHSVKEPKSQQLRFLPSTSSLCSSSRRQNPAPRC